MTAKGISSVNCLTTVTYMVIVTCRPRIAGLRQFSNPSIAEENQDEQSTLIAFLEFSFWLLKLILITAKAIKICLSFTRIRVVKMWLVRPDIEPGIIIKVHKLVCTCIGR